jgi:hypothetical protein
VARSLLRLIALVGAFLAVAPVAQAAEPCGLPDAAPWWIDFSDGSVSFRNAVFAHPGVIAASTGTQAPASLRQGGAQTVYWDMQLNAIVGTPTAPAPIDGVPAAAAALVSAAVASSGCGTPIIALNEMAGQDSKPPFSAATTAYRANLTALTQALSAAGAIPYVLVPNTPYPPYVTGAATSFWAGLMANGYVVLENYPQAPKIYDTGALVGSRTLRIGFRASVAAFTSAGLAAGKLGLMLGFQSGLGFSGREGLQPTDSWLEVVKLEQFAAQQVATETGIQSVWSWGWGTFDSAGADPDKSVAACTYLWARDPQLCDAPSFVDGDFDASRTEGQIDDLPDGVQCTIGTSKAGQISVAAIDRLARLTRGRQAAVDALTTRYLLHGRTVSQLRIRRAEQALVYARFNGSRAKYVAALARRGATPDVGRAALADGLRLQNVEGGLHVAPPTIGAVRAFRAARGGTRVRVVTSSIPLVWLGNSRSGVAIPGSDAPPQVLRARDGQTLRVPTANGMARITVGAALPLRSTSSGDANPSISSLLRAQARDKAGLAWLAGTTAKALATMSCLHDQLPSAAPQTIALRAPFLRPLR